MRRPFKSVNIMGCLLFHVVVCCVLYFLIRGAVLVVKMMVFVVMVMLVVKMMGDVLMCYSMKLLHHIFLLGMSLLV